jgi:hypothetical protein
VVKLDFNDPLPWALSRQKWNIIKKINGAPPEGGPAAEKRSDYGLDNRYFRVSLAEMQRMHMRILQCKLVQHAVNMRFRNREDVAAWEKDLKEYSTTTTISTLPGTYLTPLLLVEASKDHDYMQECTQRERDPFLVTAERLTDDEIMQEAMKHIDLGQFSPLGSCEEIQSWEKDNIPIPKTRNEAAGRNRMQKLIERLILAVLGGGLLVGPMWLMIIHNSPYVCMSSATGFVFLFGLVMAVRLEKGTDVLASTCAYAAVMVVFVGLAVELERNVESAKA